MTHPGDALTTLDTEALSRALMSCGGATHVSLPKSRTDVTPSWENISTMGGGTESLATTLEMRPRTPRAPHDIAVDGTGVAVVVGKGAAQVLAPLQSLANHLNNDRPEG